MEDAMTSHGRLGAAVLTVLLTLPLTMCGGAIPAEKAPAASPAGAPAPAPAEAGPAQSAYPQGGYPAQPGYAAPPSAATGAPDQADLVQRRAAARAEFERARSDLEAAATDCAAACRALSSMERATQHLCTLVADPDDQKRCDDAQHRLAAARERVRSSCGTCQ
jgi:hypothetical protein